MKDDESAGLCLLVIIAIWFFSSNPVSETSHWYIGLCNSGWAAGTGLKCVAPNERPRLGDTRYTVTPSASTVVYKINDFSPDLLEHCAIIDVKNWKCPNQIFQNHILEYHCNNGECFMNVVVQENRERKQLNFLEYYYLKFLLP